MDRIQLRRDSSARWAEINPILLEGEVGYEIDTKLRKIGDGVNRWNDLEYLKAEGIIQETGNSENITMSQKAITRELTELGSEVGKVIYMRLFLVGSIKCIAQYDSPLKINSATTIKVTPSKSSTITGVSITVIRDGGTKYLGFLSGEEYFYFSLLPNDEIKYIYTNGGEDGELCEVQFVADNGIAHKVETFENALNQQSQTLTQLNNNIEILGGQISVINTEIGVYSTFTSGTIRYIAQYSPYKEIQKDTTLQVITPSSSTINGVSVTLIREGGDKYLSTFKNENVYTLDLLAGDTIKFIYVSGGVDGEICKVQYVGEQDELLKLQEYAFRDGKKWMAIGDSLTSVATLGEGVDNYVTLVAKRLGLTAINKGIGGTGYWKQKIANEAFFQRIPTYTESVDVITIFGSFNDLGVQDGVNGKGIIGSAADVGTDTICGCINETFDAIERQYPNAIVGVITPTPWSNSHDDNYAEMYVEKLKEIASYRSIPCLDLYHCSNLRPWSESFRSAYYKTASDGAHPNNLGHQRISGMIADFIHSMMY